MKGYMERVLLLLAIFAVSIPSMANEGYFSAKIGMSNFDSNSDDTEKSLSGAFQAGVDTFPFISGGAGIWHHGSIKFGETEKDVSSVTLNPRIGVPFENVYVYVEPAMHLSKIGPHHYKGGFMFSLGAEYRVRSWLTVGLSYNSFNNIKYKTDRGKISNLSLNISMITYSTL